MNMRPLLFVLSLTRPTYEEGDSVMTVVSSDHDSIDPITRKQIFEHPIFRFFTIKEARELRLVCREFKDNVEITPFTFYDGDRLGYTYGRHTAELWSECFPKLCELHMLNVYNIRTITDGLFRLTALTALTLSDRLGDDGIIAIAVALPSLKALTYLDLSSNLLHDRGAIALAEVLPKTLTHLHLHYNFIDDAGAIALAAALPATLTSLILYSNNIRDVGAIALAKVLPSMTALMYLSLESNYIEEEGEEALDAAALLHVIKRW